MTKENKVYPFKIQGIQAPEFSTFPDVFKEGADIRLDTEFAFGSSIRNHSLGVKFTVNFRIADKPFIALVVICDFDIEEKTFQGFFSRSMKKYLVPKELFTHLSVLTIGTARGILHEKLSKTKFPQFILPSLNISNLIAEDIELSDDDSGSGS